MTDSTTGILALIDAAVDDWETSPDAVRYNTADVPERWEPGTGQITLTIHQAALTRFMSDCGWQLRAMAVMIETDMTPSFRDAHASMMRIAKAFRIKPGLIGHVGCFCHPAPFPAARDYRRRTKHRNRRRR